MLDDQQLLRQYATDGSEAAFGEVVARHVNLVYSTALRQTGGDSQLAQDAAQLVFADLARKARSLPANVILAGWLHRATCFAARQLLRTEHRRHQREQQAVIMNAIESEAAADWEIIRPLLDEALDHLSRADRDALLLRYFEQRSLAEVGAALCSNEDAARKRVSRALEKIRAFLARRGANTTATTFALALSSNAVHAAPAAWAATLAGSSLASVATPTATTLTILKLMTITKTQIIGVVAVAVALTVGAIALVASRQRPIALQSQNTAAYQIIPGIGTGPVKLGMTLAEVEKILGKPGPGGLYARLGLGVITDPGDPMHVSQIMVMSRDTSGAPVGGPGGLPADLKDFAGATKEGIRLGSTGPEVLQALGKPDGSDVPSVGWEMLNYRTLGLVVDLQDEHVRAMIIAKPSDKTMTVATDAKPVSAPSPAVSTADWIVTPKFSIGPIKFGMTRPQVEEILGKPVQIARGNTYEYYQDGLILTFNPAPRGVFGMSVVGTGKTGGLTVSAAGISYLDFAGATKEGIRIGSKRAAVVQAFGKGEQTSNVANTEELTFSALALTVRLENGQVTQMVLMVH